MKRHKYLPVLLTYFLVAFVPKTEANQLVPYSSSSTNMAVWNYGRPALPVPAYHPPQVNMPIIPVTSINLPSIVNPYLSNPTVPVSRPSSVPQLPLPVISPPSPAFSGQLVKPSDLYTPTQLDPNMFNLNSSPITTRVLAEIQNRETPKPLIMPSSSPPPVNALQTRSRQLGYNFVQFSPNTQVQQRRGNTQVHEGAGARVRDALRRCKRGVYPEDTGPNPRPPSEEYRYFTSAFDAEDMRQGLEGESSYMKRFENMVETAKADAEAAGKKFDGTIDWRKFLGWNQPNYATAMAGAGKFIEDAYNSDDLGAQMAGESAMKEMEIVVRKRNKQLDISERQGKLDAGHVTTYNAWRNKYNEMYSKYEKDGIFKKPPPPERVYTRPANTSKGGGRRSRRPPGSGCP